MDGNKTGNAIGLKEFVLGDTKYDTKIGIGKVREYIKTIKNIGLRMRFAEKKDEVEKIVDLSDEILDYKQSFLKDALINAGMDKEEANELVEINIIDVIKEGNIELWLNFITEKDLKKDEEVKN